jgi:hypothetical protein
MGGGTAERPANGARNLQRLERSMRAGGTMRMNPTSSEKLRVFTYYFDS